MAILFLDWVVIELPPEHLHAQECEDHDEQEKEEKERCDGLDGVEERGDKVGERTPVPEEKIMTSVCGFWLYKTQPLSRLGLPLRRFKVDLRDTND